MVRRLIAGCCLAMLAAGCTNASFGSPPSGGGQNLGQAYGRGVFATRAFAKGESVESCPTLELPEDTVTGRPRTTDSASARSAVAIAQRGSGRTAAAAPTASHSRARGGCASRLTVW